MLWFRPKTTDNPLLDRANRKFKSDELSSFGVRSKSDAIFRKERIKEISSMLLASKDSENPAESIAKMANLVDTWVIEPIGVNGEPAWLPRPLWDNEAMLSRDSFSSEDEARNYVLALGGTMPLMEQEPPKNGE